MGWQAVRDLIEAAVVYSDNDSFIALRAAFDRVGYEDWIVGLGIDYDTALDPMSDFPTYCPRTSARLWREMSGFWCATRQAGLARVVTIRHAMQASSTSMAVPMS